MDTALVRFHVPTMTIDGSIDPRYALDLGAAAAYEAHSGTAVPAPRCPLRKA